MLHHSAESFDSLVDPPAGAPPQPEAPVTREPEATEQPEPAEQEARPESEAGKTLNQHKGKLEKRRDSIQKQIDDAVARREAAKREAEDFERRRDLGKRELEQLARQRQPETRDRPERAPWDDPRDPEPKLDQFEDHDSYLRAVRAYDRRSIQREMAVRQQHQQAQQSRQQIQQQFAERLNAYAKTDPEFFEDLSASDVEVPIGSPMEFVLETSSAGPQLLKHFAVHPDDAQRVMALPPSEQFAQMRVLEYQLGSTASSVGPVASERRISSAAQPIKPAGGGRSSTDDGDLDADSVSVDDHIRRYKDLAQKSRR